MLINRLLSFVAHSATATACSLGARGRHHHNNMHLVPPPSRGNKLERLIESPSKLFNSILAILMIGTVIFKIMERSTRATPKTRKKKPAGVKSLQARFLIVFWLIRCADWLQGPYFYEVYASKVPGSIISKLFVAGFASAALFGPLVGRCSDFYGRKRATLVFCIFYILGASSTESSSLSILLLGRILSGIGTSLMFSSPEAWLVAESQRQRKDDPDGAYLEETFGLAYAVDSIVAIVAGQLSVAAASHRGLTGPFELSIAFLFIAGLLTTLLWEENTARNSENDATSKKPSIQEALKVVCNSPDILLLGAAQSLFEASMYIFIMQWPPAISHAVEMVYGATVEIPYGAILSCFMAACLLGATLFGHLSKLGIPTEESTALMLIVADLAMGSATTAASTPEAPLASLMIAFLVFEGCVGIYFPSTSALRSKYVPDAHRSIIMTLFGIPLNVLVVSVFLANQRLGVSGSLGIATGALNLSAMCMWKLHSMSRRQSSTVTFK